MKPLSRSRRMALATLTFAAVMVPAGYAQTPPPPIVSATHYTVKPGRAGDMAAAIKEYNEVLKKAHYEKYYTVWRSLSGPTEMLLVRHLQKWSELDQTRDPALKDYEADLARISARIDDCFSAIARDAGSVNAQMSLPLAAEPPKMIVIWQGRVKPEKMAEVVGLFQSDYFPAVKAAGSKTFTFTTMRFGAPANEIKITSDVDSWATFDGQSPVVTAMGPEKAKAFQGKVGAALESHQYDVYRFDAALSYLPSGK